MTFSEQKLHCERDRTAVSRRNKIFGQHTSSCLAAFLESKLSWLWSCTMNSNLWMRKRLWYCLMKVDIVKCFFFFLFWNGNSCVVPSMVASEQRSAVVSIEKIASELLPRKCARFVRKMDVVCKHKKKKKKPTRFKRSHVLYSFAFIGFCNWEVVVLTFLKYCVCLVSCGTDGIC